MTHDSQSIIWSTQWEPILERGLLLGMLAIVVCPIIAIVGAIRSVVPNSIRLAWLATEGAIVFAHFVALAPGVQ